MRTGSGLRGRESSAGAIVKKASNSAQGIQRKMINCYRAMWAAEGEAAIRTVVDTARLTGGTLFGTILKVIGA